MITRINGLRRRSAMSLWLAELRAQLRRHGATLEADIGPGARFDAAPHVKVTAQGEGERVLRLTLAEGVSLGRDTTLEVWGQGTSELRLQAGSYCTSNVRIQLRGGRIAIGEHAHVRDGAVLKSQGAIDIGREVTVSFGDVIACTERIEIGDFVGLGERVTITDSDHTHDGSDTHYLVQPLRVTPVRLGRNVLVSANAVILRGADVGPNAVIAAGAVVGAGEHPGGHLLAGAPARVVRALGSSAP